MSSNFTWNTGKDGTQYYIDERNGHVAGMIQTASNGPDIFKVGFGIEFVAPYKKEANAKAAVEKIVGASTATRSLMATKNTRKTKTAGK